MAESHQRFGELLEEGIKRVHIVQKKPIGYILDTFGYELRQDGSKGRYALGHWYYKKRIPASLQDVEILARLIVLNSDVDRDWLARFLESAGHPEPGEICKRYFLPAPEDTRAAESARPIPQAEPAPLPESAPSSPALVEVEAQAILPEPAPKAQKKPGMLFLYAVGIVLTLAAAGLLAWNRLLPALSPSRRTPTAAVLVTGAVSPTSGEKVLTLPPTPSLAAQVTSSPVNSPTELPVDPSAYNGKCPAAGAPPEFRYQEADSMRQFLNAGGSQARLKDEFEKELARNPSLLGGRMASADLTGDGVSEMVVNVLTESGSLWQVLGCHAGAYLPLFETEYGNDDLILLHTVVDMNDDRRAEIVRFRQIQQEKVRAAQYSIQEWDGKSFQELINPQWFDQVRAHIPADAGPWETIVPSATVDISDTNADGLDELLVTGGLISEHPTCETVFQRQHTDRWIWDGKFFQFDDRTYSQPIYRFQSALDGDVAFALREYDRSLAAYQKAIFSTEIHPRNWLPPQLEHCRRIGSGFDGAGVDPTQESLQLGAYARWRIVLIHAIQNHKDAMEVVYKTLQEKFPPGVTGHDYAAIGAAFWETYTKSNDISAACEKAKEAAQGLALYPGHEPATICFLP